jgi:AcrR family transcriptional regulator
MSPRSALRSAEMRDRSRSRLMKEALRLFGERGFASTPVEAVARAAGLSPGLVYHYFDSKSALLRAIFEQSLADVRQTFAAADAEPDPERRLSALLRSATTVVRKHRAFWALSYGVRMQREVIESLGPLIGAWTSSIQDVLERYLRAAGIGEPALEARLLFAQIDGMYQHFVLDPGGYPIDALTERLVARYAAQTRKLPTASSTRRPRIRRGLPGPR